MKTTGTLNRLLDAEKPSIPRLLKGWQEKLASSKKSEEHLAWLKKSLQAAVSLEFATIPPYLAALWSIKDELHPVAKSIRNIVQEEMLHMSLACNMLASIGGEPRICDPPSFVPHYPGPLPGGVHPKLVVSLSGLNKQALDGFLTIESPGQFPPNVESDEIDRRKPERTIGEFYSCIYEGFKKYRPTLSPDNQITGPLSWVVIEDLVQVKQAIGIIKHQGEGAIQGPVSSGKDDYAHYFRFKEVLLGRKLVLDKSKNKYVYGNPVDPPEVWPMATVPDGGYRQEDVTPDVWHLIDRFDSTYSDLLRFLQNAWRRGGQASFLHSIETMFLLERYAKQLMQIPIPEKSKGACLDDDGKPKTYGPCFRYKAISTGDSQSS